MDDFIALLLTEVFMLDFLYGGGVGFNARNSRAPAIHGDYTLEPIPVQIRKVTDRHSITIENKKQHGRDLLN